MRHVVCLLTLLVLCGSARAASRALTPPPNLLADVTFDQQIGRQIPLDLSFQDAQGRRVRLGSLLQNRPTILVPGYYQCTNLCSLVRAGVASAIRQSGLPPRSFNVILLSIDPTESPADASATQRDDAKAHPDAAVTSWHYLTGDSGGIAALTRAIGFAYLFDPRNSQYAHGAGVVILTPTGTISQYLFGVQFAAQTLRLALVHASQGHLGTVVDRLLLMCCDYDPSTGRYSLMISRVLQALGILTALGLAALVIILRRAERPA